MEERRSLLDRIEELSFVRAIRRGLVMTIPLLMIGSFALVCNILPIPAYQSFLAGGGNWLSQLFVTVNQVTFGVLALCSVISVSASYARIRHNQTAVVLGASFAALCAYAIFIGLFTEGFSIDSLGAQGMFTGLVSATAGSALYCWLVEQNWFSFRLYTVGADVDFNTTVTVIVPVALVALAAYVVNAIISIVFNVNGFEALFHQSMDNFFGLFENLSLKALLFVVISNLLWFFGIHGTNVLEGVAVNIFYGEATGEAILVGFLNKPVIDVFILMGGCGTTISLLVAILLFSKKKNSRSLAKMAAFPMWFNINEMLVFGLPIVFNASFFLPFILVPLVCVGITALAITSGFVPQPQGVDWVMPIFVNGYLSTGSIRGVILQVVNIMAGAFIYRYFLLRYEKRTNDRIMHNLDALIGRMKKAEEGGEALVLLEMRGGPGGLAKMLAADFQHMLDEPEFLKIFYQPQYNEKSVCIGAEALMRWHHPLCGIIYPPLVIGLAAETGLLPKLERAVFRLACRDIAIMQEAGVCPPSVSVNATAATLQDPDFVNYLRDLFEEFPTVPGIICIELTEQMSFILGERVENQLRVIQDMGVRFEVDDFSMGHTSVKYLQSNLFDVVKLDGSLVTDITTNERSVEIVSSIVHMAKTMGFKVMAEFVETIEQRDMLRELGCYLYQGYLFSPAIPLEKLMERLENENNGASAVKKTGEISG